MNTQLLGLWAYLLVTPPAIEARMERLGDSKNNIQQVSARSGHHHRAVVLFHGLRIQPVNAAAVHRAEPSFWEKGDAPLLKVLSNASDVYGFHYAQSSTVDDVAHAPALFRSIQQLREAGYSEIVLVGYSAGAVVARLFVEDYPDSGVTKLVQVGAPNGGSDWTVLSHGVRAPQVSFIESLTKDSRRVINQVRADRKFPNHVEFVCLVTVSNWIGDGIVRRDSQWTPELQIQNIPAETILLPHVGAMYSHRLSAKIRDLVETPQPRWTPEQVRSARNRVLGLTAVMGRAERPAEPPFGMFRP